MGSSVGRDESCSGGSEAGTGVIDAGGAVSGVSMMGAVGILVNDLWV